MIVPARSSVPANLRAGLFGRGTRVSLAGDPARWTPAIRQLPFVRDVAVHDRSLEVSLDDPDAQNPALIKTVYGAGYLFLATVSWR